MTRKSYLRASATASFAYGIPEVRAQGVTHQVRRGRHSRTEGGARQHRQIGELKNVLPARRVQRSDGYRNIPLTSMPYGQAMAILALGEFKRAFV